MGIPGERKEEGVLLSMISLNVVRGSLTFNFENSSLLMKMQVFGKEVIVYENGKEFESFQILKLERKFYFCNGEKEEV